MTRPTSENVAIIVLLGLRTRWCENPFSHHIQGPSTARKLPAEAAWQGIRHSSHLGDYYERMLHGDEQRKRIALVATAHHLGLSDNLFGCSRVPWANLFARA